ncbi:hypothetical protein [Paraclostridium sordellii]|uniref:hypothetical protein n=1 Tax=Paraclostridium sordellii TaxID=1505 RepID=UPI0005E199C1|nr:hypothetical protein [Paeniclostridium sordellii]CEO26610.1 Uncharacterised protein [[Clostridium] sordellii] [Paeniclostridium sordellii]
MEILILILVVVFVLSTNNNQCNKKSHNQKKDSIWSNNNIFNDYSNFDNHDCGCHHYNDDCCSDSSCDCGCDCNDN